LVAYGVHLGNTVGSDDKDYVHYKAYVKTDIGWAEIDDANVRILCPEEESSVRRSAYFCLYSTIDNEKA
jgi:ubiquitin C-terminal hydrolase